MSGLMGGALEAAGHSAKWRKKRQPEPDSHGACEEAHAAAHTFLIDIQDKIDLFAPIGLFAGGDVFHPEGADDDMRVATPTPIGHLAAAAACAGAAALVAKARMVQPVDGNTLALVIERHTLQAVLLAMATAGARIALANRDGKLSEWAETFNHVGGQWAVAEENEE